MVEVRKYFYQVFQLLLIGDLEGRENGRVGGDTREEEVRRGRGI